MKPELMPVARIELPDNWEPDGVMCVRVMIPNDQQYLAILTGWLDQLKWSKVYARDETLTGASIVSRTFQSALESQPILTGCTMSLLRQNPDNECETQYSNDNGETWTAIRIADCPLPPPPIVSNQRCIATSRVILFMRGVIADILEDLWENGLNYTETYTHAITTIQAVTGSVSEPMVTTGLYGLISLLDGLGGVSSYGYEDIDSYADVFDQVYLAVLETGEVQGSILTELLDWSLNTHENDVFYAWSQVVVGLMVAGKWNILASYGSTSCLEFGTYTWTKVFDFTDGEPLDWTVIDPAILSLLAAPTVGGWVSDEWLDGGDLVCQVNIRKSENTFHLYNCTMEYTLEWSGGSPAKTWRLGTYDNSDYLITRITDEGENNTITATAGDGLATIWAKGGLSCYHNVDSHIVEGEDDRLGIIHKLTLRGRGYNPYFE